VKNKMKNFEYLFNRVLTEMLYNTTIAEKNKVEVIKEMAQDMVEFGIHEACVEMPNSLFKAFQLINRIDKEYGVL
jgi:hypothetical protein